jgi:hypothetical protein
MQQQQKNYSIDHLNAYVNDTLENTGQKNIKRSFHSNNNNKKEEICKVYIRFRKK